MDEPIKLLQEYLKKNNLDSILVPRADEHLSEYIAPYAERLKWVSNFSGSGIGIWYRRYLFKFGPESFCLTK